MFKVSVAALSAAASLLAVAPAAATVVIDQATIPETGTIGFAGGSAHQLGAGGIGQLFTVGVTGVLDHIAVAAEHWTFAGAAAGIRFRLQDASFNTLLTRDVAANDVPDFGFGGFDWANTLQFDVRAANISVTAGQQYVLRLSSLGGGDASNWRSGFAGQSISYAGGHALSYDGPPGFPVPYVLGNDFGFRTYVDNGLVENPDPGAVPEPATWALMIGGFGLAGASLRRRRVLTVA